MSYLCASLFIHTYKNLHLLHFTVSKVEDMSFMFRDAFSFNGDVSSWQPSNATNFRLAFNNANSFNKDVSTWSISSATNMELMFYNATSFNQNLCLWADDFPYDGVNGDKSRRIFQDSGCTNQGDPVRANRGPFCATTVCP